MIREKEAAAYSGLPVLAFLVVALAFLTYDFVDSVRDADRLGLVLDISGFVLWLVLLCGFFMVQPNQGKVLQLFGRYVGTVRKAGLWWTNPFYTAKAISLRVRNFETTKLKVNDHGSNPVEIGAVVVWQVVDTAEAMFQVDNYENYVHVQSESALRGLANHYPYDSHGEEGAISLSGNTADVAERLKVEIQERMVTAGVKVLEARITHLAYAPEIANAMLRRQQAGAVIAARRLIVDGAVGMVEQALQQLSQKRIVTLDEERKAAMVSNLLVVLCSEQSTTPVVNAGSIY